VSGCLRFRRPDEIPQPLVAELASKLTPQAWIARYERQVRGRRCPPAGGGRSRQEADRQGPFGPRPNSSQSPLRSQPPKRGCAVTPKPAWKTSATTAT